MYGSAYNAAVYCVYYRRDSSLAAVGNGDTNAFAAGKNLVRGHGQQLCYTAARQAAFE